MPNEIDLLCPNCSASLAPWMDSRSEKYSCGECGKEFHFKDGVYCFVENDAYLDTFSFEWKKHARMYDSESERQATERTLRKLHITPEAVRGKRVLDVGCGTGRFTRTVAGWGASVTAVDLSEAIFVARQNVADEELVLAQADLFNLPFPHGYFDVILAWGVLHHTPDTEAAFNAVVRHLKRGGMFAVMIYGKSKGSRRRMRNFYRKITPHLPMRLLYAICFLAGPMYYIYKIPIIGQILRVLIPFSMQRDFQMRIQESFDEFSPKYAWRHTFPEVHQWFVNAGMTDNRFYDPPIYAVGWLHPNDAAVTPGTARSAEYIPL